MSCSFTNQVLAQMKLHAEAADMELGVEVLSRNSTRRSLVCILMRSAFASRR